MSSWKEEYKGGSAEAERVEFEQLTQLMLDAQLKSRKAAGARHVDRAFHAKSIAACGGAHFRFADDLPDDLQIGFAQPGQQYEAQVRISNAASSAKPDDEKDLRGLAVRIRVSHDEHHDLLATNFPIPHARDARQFVLFAHAVAGGRLSRIKGILKLFFQLGPAETVRMLKNIRSALHTSESLAMESYWSRGAIRWGDEAVRYIFKPVADVAPLKDSFSGAGHLGAEFMTRQMRGDIEFDLYVQRFINEKSTPIEDAAVEWSESVSAPVHVATLVLPQRDLSAVDARAEQRVINDMGFNPWNTTEEFRPLGHLNRARKAAYDGSLAHRQTRRFKEPRPPIQNRIFGTAARSILRTINRYRPWHRLPLLVSLLNLDALRHDLRVHNLLDTEPREAPPQARNIPAQTTDDARMYRSYEGSSNDLSAPDMGAVGQTFGRNMPAQEQSVDDPNPVTVCRELMDRKTFIPATIVNVLAAGWIQFQVHDWVAHARHKLGEKDLIVPIPDKYPPFANTPEGEAERMMRIAGNIPHPNATGDGILFANASSHWWDGSQVYGYDAKNARKLREGAKLRLDENGYLPENIHGFEMTGFNESWWMGLSVLHTLFAREHNVLCDELQKAYPTWDDERTYQTARLIVSALIAKIHTVEWTPAILATEALDIGMKTNWYGPPSGDWLTKLGIWLTDTHALKGIPQTLPDHHSAPYSLTEEFATVYRMHPLIPDDYIFYNFETGKERSRKSFTEIQGAMSDDEFRKLGMRDALYSFGIAHPGAITLHNFPRTLQNFHREGETIDLSVVDIVRTRARHVPRYNEFRQKLHMPAVRDFDEMTASQETNRKLQEIYGKVDNVDTVVGLLGENPPDGFGFSDTAFRIFILMASRRLQSDRFLTVDFRPEVYSPLGMDWIENNTMTSVILRHCPELASVIPKGGNAFAPWRPIY